MVSPGALDTSTCDARAEVGVGDAVCRRIDAPSPIYAGLRCGMAISSATLSASGSITSASSQMRQNVVASPR